MNDALFNTAWGTLAVAVAAGSLVLVATLVVLSRPRSVRLKGRLEAYAGDAGGLEETEKRGAWRRDLDPVHGVTERLLGRTRVWQAIERKRERANLTASPAEILFWSVALGLAGAVVAAIAGLGALLVVFAGVAAAALPWAWISAKARHRSAAFDEQLPDVLMTMAGALKVGQSFNQSMRAIVDEGVAPANEEFGRVLAESRIGRPMDDALEAMADRIDSDDLRFVLMSVNVQREVGGSLSEFFHTVSDTVRQRQQFRRKVKALTAMGRMTAMLLLALPFVTGFFLALVGDGYLEPLFTTTAGQAMVVVILILMIIGTLILRRIADIKG